MLICLTRKRTIPWRAVVALAILILVVPTLAAASGKRVERWVGEIHFDRVDSQNPAHCPGCKGNYHDAVTQRWDLMVYDDGTVSGTIDSELTLLTYQQSPQPADSCGWVLFRGNPDFPDFDTGDIRYCYFSLRIDQPKAAVSVTGRLMPSIQPGEPRSIYFTSTTTQTKCQTVQTTRAEIWGWHKTAHRYVLIMPFYDETTWDCTPSTGYIVIREPSDGLRPPRGLLNGVDFNQQISGTSTWTRFGYLVGYTDAPTLTLDKELLERSTFLAKVPVSDQFTARLKWNSADQGTVTWQLGDAAPEQVGPTAAEDVPKVVDVGDQNMGTTPLIVQAKNALGKQSAPEYTQVAVAPKPIFTPFGLIFGVKHDDVVQYKHSFTWPDPAAKGIVMVPSFIPFFGGKELGLQDSQIRARAEVLSTGEGSLEGRGQTGFAAAGSAVKGFLEGKAKGVLDQEGWSLTDGSAKFGIEGKIEKSEALLKVIPALTGPVTAIEQFSPGAAQILKQKAQAKLTLTPYWNFAFNFEAPRGSSIQFKDAETTQGLGVKMGVDLNLIENFLRVFFGIGGDVSVTLRVPEPYFKQAVIKMLAFAKITIWRFAYDGEANYVQTIPGSAAVAGLQDIFETSAASAWQEVDRSYLAQPSYARWTGDAATAQAVGANGADVTLVENVNRQAGPALATRAASGQETSILVWTHDRPDLPAVQGGEIAWSENKGAGWSAPAFLTHDNYDDAYPQAVYLSDGRALVVWQRMDTPTPGDLNTSLAGYLSHMQIAAAVKGSGAAPKQLSASGSINYGVHLAATTAGALAVWINNPANHLIGDAASPDRVFYATFTAGSNAWSAPAPILTDLKGMTGLDVAATGNRAALVYSLDMDGDLTTPGDSEIFYILWQNGAWGAPARLTNNTVPDLAPRVALTDAGAPLLVWQQEGALKFLAGSWAAAPQNLALPSAAERLDYRLTRGSDGNLALTWQAPGSGETPIGYALYDAAAGRWGAERSYAAPPITGAVTPTMGMATGIAPALLPSTAQNPARLMLGYQLAHLELITKTVNGVQIPNMPIMGQNDLHLATLPLGIDLRVASADLWADDSATVHAAIHNDGTLAAANVPLVLQGPTAAQSLIVTLPLIAAGDVVTATFNLPAPMRELASYTVMADPAATLPEADRNNNQARLGMPLGLVMLPSTPTLDAITVSAVITSGGPIHISGPVTVTLTLEDVAGLQVGETQAIFPQAPTAEITVSVPISTGLLGPGRHLIFWALDASRLPANADRDAAVAATTVLVGPDLAASPLRIGFGAAPGATAPFVIDVQNLGNWTSHGGAVEVWDGRPDKATSHRLLRLPLPDIEPMRTQALSGVLQLSGLPAATTGLTGLWVSLDPDKAIEEFNENNNLIAVGNVLTGDDPAVQQRTYLPLLSKP